MRNMQLKDAEFESFVDNDEQLIQLLETLKGKCKRKDNRRIMEELITFMNLK